MRLVQGDRTVRPYLSVAVVGTAKALLFPVHAAAVKHGARAKQNAKK
jgi:hypothetical protein